jgi:hydrogenase assembly chaperone HypC/HupF
MCIASPARVMSVADDFVLLDQDGRRSRASRLLVPELEPGDWVVVATGTVIQRLEPDLAADLIATLDRARADAAAARVAEGAPS